MVLQCNASNQYGYAYSQGYLNVVCKYLVSCRVLLSYVCIIRCATQQLPEKVYSAKEQRKYPSMVLHVLANQGAYFVIFVLDAIKLCPTLYVHVRFSVYMC